MHPLFQKKTCNLASLLYKRVRICIQDKLLDRNRFPLISLTKSYCYRYKAEHVFFKDAHRDPLHPFQITFQTINIPPLRPAFVKAIHRAFNAGQHLHS